MKKQSSSSIGRITALLIAYETIIFAISLIWEFINQSELASDLGYFSSLLIAGSVVMMMASFADLNRDPSRLFGSLALVSATIYAPLCIATYYLQLSTITSNSLNLSREVLEVITFKPSCPIFAIDMLGYCFLCLSTLAAGFALTEQKDRILKALCFFHEALAVPTIVSPILSSLFLIRSGETDFTGHYGLLF